jgi:hypothetical protein
MMFRVSVCLLPAVLSCCFASAQFRSDPQALMGNRRGDLANGCHRLYFCLSTGINNANGLFGPQLDVAITGRISTAIGLGYGTWGPKANLEGRYYFEPCNRGFALGLGATYATGSSDAVEVRIKTRSGTEKATFEQRPAFNATISGYYFGSIGKRGNRFYFQAGYSLPLHGGRLTQLSGPSIDPEARRPLMIIPPGGPIVAVGVSIGFGRF